MYLAGANTNVMTPLRALVILQELTCCQVYHLLAPNKAVYIEQTLGPGLTG